MHTDTAMKTAITTATTTTTTTAANTIEVKGIKVKLSGPVQGDAGLN